MKKLMSFLKLAWSVSFDYIVLLVLQALTAAAKLWLNVLLPKYLIDELLGAKDAKTLIFLGALIVANNVGMSWLEKLYKRFIEVKKEYLRRAMTERMAEKIMNLEYSYLEDPYYLDLKERAVFAIGNQDSIAGLVTVASKVFSGALTIAGLVAILATLGWFILLVLGVGVALMLLCYKSMSDQMTWVMGNLIPINRKFGYYIRLMYEKQYQKDTRLYGMQDMIVDKYTEFADNVRSPT